MSVTDIQRDVVNKTQYNSNSKTKITKIKFVFEDFMFQVKDQ